MEYHHTFNIDQERRDLIIWPNGYVPQPWEHVAPGGEIIYMGGVARFEISLRTLYNLVMENFIDVNHAQNESPTVEEFLIWANNLIKKYPKVNDNLFFIGYAVSDERPDYRVSIEGVLIKGPVSQRIMNIFKKEFRKADELTCTTKLCRAWYD